ncbi:MAG: hypothetical protein FWD68_07615 [Alphaproteobacteria bacterium]|nr:hypothetical protein [Alphaproteobacteria bacterium]
MALLSQSALEQLNKPHHIYYSKLKLIFFTALIGVFAAIFLLGGLMTSLKKGGGGSAVMFMGLGVVLLVMMIVRTLPSWRGLGEPAVTISIEGLRFRGETVIPWSSIEENDWHSQGIMGVTSAANILLRAGRPKRKIQALFFKCDGEEYLHYCNLYEAASRQG